MALGATAAGLPILAARRILAGVGAGIGSYDAAKAYADSRAGNFKPDEVVAMSVDDVNSRMESMEARARVEGKNLDSDPQYKSLRRELRDRISGRHKADLTDEGINAGDYEGKKMAEIMKGADEDIKDAARALVLRDRALKVAAVGIGLLAGSGLAAKGIVNSARGVKEFFGAGVAHADTIPQSPGEFAPGDAGVADHAPATVDTHVAVEAPTGAAHEVAATPEAAPSFDETTTIHRGDGYVKIFARQMEGDPAKFGYDPLKDGDDIHKWAMKGANSVVKEQGLMDRRLGFDAKHPMQVKLNPDRSFTTSGNVEIAPHVPGAEVDAKVNEIIADAKKTINGGLAPGEASPSGSTPDLLGGAPERDVVSEILAEPGRNPLLESGIDQNGHFESPGVKLDFSYNNDGSVSGFHSETINVNHKFDVLKDQYEYNPPVEAKGQKFASLFEHQREFGMEVFEMDAQNLGTEMRVYNTLVEAGQQHSAEAKTLLQDIKKSAIDIYQEAGSKALKPEVFRQIDAWEKVARLNRMGLGATKGVVESMDPVGHAETPQIPRDPLDDLGKPRIEAAKAIVEAKTSAAIENGRFESKGMKALFRYDNGKVVDVNPAETGSSKFYNVHANGYEFDPPKGTMWQENPTFGASIAEQDARVFGIKMQLYKEMSSLGQQNTPEGKYLLKALKTSASALSRDAGPKFLDPNVFKDIQGWESAANKG